MNHFYKQDYCILNEDTAAQRHARNMSFEDWGRLYQSNPDQYAFLRNSRDAKSWGDHASKEMAKGDKIKFGEAKHYGDRYKTLARGGNYTNSKRDGGRPIMGDVRNGHQNFLGGTEKSPRTFVSQSDSGKWMYNDDIFIPDSRKERYKSRYSLRDRAKFYKKHPDRLLATAKHKATQPFKAAKNATKSTIEGFKDFVKAVKKK